VEEGERKQRKGLGGERKKEHRSPLQLPQRGGKNVKREAKPSGWKSQWSSSIHGGKQFVDMKAFRVKNK